MNPDPGPCPHEAQQSRASSKNWFALVAILLLVACTPAASSTISPDPPSTMSPIPTGTASPTLATTAAALLIHFANRSASAITVGPGLSIPACGTASATRAAYDAARLTAGEMAVAGKTWDAPAGALVWDMAFAFEPTQDLTVVITSTAPVAVRMGLVAEADLPACGGAPMGIEPGLPQGVTLTVTPLP